jgi:hypothetical protein
MLKPRTVLAVVAPAALAVFPILALWAENAREATASDLFLPLGTALAFGIVLTSVGALLLDGRDRGAVWAAACVVLLWLWSPAAAALAPAAAGPVAAGAAVGVLGFASAALLAWRMRRAPIRDELVFALGAVALLLVALPLTRLLWTLQGERSAPGERSVFAAPAPSGSGAPASGEPGSGGPDIYWIVLDAFGRADVLRDEYGIERGLAEDLEDLGFYVAERAVANYSTTLHTLPSVLNKDYVRTLVPGTDPDGRAVGPLFHLMRDSRVVRSLRERGYTWIAYSSGYASTEVGEAADVVIEPPAPLTEFQMHLLERSPLGWLADELPMRSPYRAHRRRILHVLETLPEIAEDPRPTFTFAHLLSPHHPFVFGEGGEDVSPADRPFRFNDGGVGGRPAAPGEVHEEYVEAYRAQTIYIGTRVAEMVAELLAQSPEPPIIIVQSDHGPNSRWPHVDPAERMPILLAFFAPPDVEALLDPRMSPVNSFRAVLHGVFGDDLPRLPDRHYLSSYEEPWRFEPVHRPLRPLPPLRPEPREPPGREDGDGN